MLKKILQFLLFAGLGACILYYIYYSQQKSYLSECIIKGIPEAQCNLFDKLKHDFSALNYSYVLLTIFIYLLSNFFRAKRWEMLLSPLGVQAKTANTFGATLIGYLVNIPLPRAGEFAKASALSRNENITFDKSFGTVVTDRLVDFICLISASIITLVLAHDVIYDYLEKTFHLSSFPTWLNDNLFILVILIGGFFSTFFTLYKYRNIFLESAFGKKITAFLSGLYEGLMSITKLKNVSLFILYSVLIWSSYFLMAYVMFKAYGPTQHLGMIAGLVVFFFGSLGVVFPSPGGMGSYHYTVMIALSLYSINSTESFVYANLMFFSIQLLANLFFGGLAFIWMQWTSNKTLA